MSPVMFPDLTGQFPVSIQPKAEPMSEKLFTTADLAPLAQLLIDARGPQKLGNPADALSLARRIHETAQDMIVRLLGDASATTGAAWDKYDESSFRELSDEAFADLAHPVQVKLRAQEDAAPVETDREHHGLRKGDVL